MNHKGVAKGFFNNLRGLLLSMALALPVMISCSTGITNASDNLTGGSDTTLPMIISTSPLNNAIDVTINSAISVTFSEAMDPVSINSISFKINGNSAAVTGTVSYSGVTAIFTPTVNLNYSTLYTATVTTMVKDLAGNSLAAEYVWSFTTGASADTTAPLVSSTVPTADALGVSVSSAISVTFSETMNASTITTATFSVNGGGSADIAGTVTYSGVTATFTPTASLSYNTLYTATIGTGVKDLAGNALATSHIWKFTTAGTPDNTAPTVVSVEPVNNTLGVALNRIIKAIFSEPMKSSSITTTTFAASPGYGDISGIVSYSGNTATLTPSAKLTPNTTYNVRITNGATDLAGNALTTFNWSFTTGYLRGGTWQGGPWDLTNSVGTYAGQVGVVGTDDLIGTAAKFKQPFGMTTDGDNLFLVDTLNHTIRKIVISTGSVSTLAGSPGISGTTDDTGTLARFNTPFSLTTDGTNLYVADTLNNTIRKVVIATGVVTTLAGQAGVAGSSDATGTAASFNSPRDVTIVGSNDLYVADNTNHVIRKIVISTGVVTTFAGGMDVSGTTDDTGTLARFNQPRGLTTDGTNLFVADTVNNTVRKIVISSGVVTTIAGNAGVSGTADNIGNLATFNQPMKLTTDGTNLYVSDTMNHTIRKIVIATGNVTTIAGLGGTSGSSDGAGSLARFNQPMGLVSDGNNLYILDRANSTVRRIWGSGFVSAGGS